VLEIDDLQVSFGQVRAVAGVSLRIGTGESVGLIGPNGSGKSTLVNAITGVVRGRGRIAVDGRPIRPGSPRSAARHGIARTFQTPQTFLELSCIDNVRLGLDRDLTNGLTGAWPLHPWAARVDRRRWEQAMTLLDWVGLAAQAETSAAALSYGQQRMLELARAVAADPAILLLDEPAAGLNHAETDALATRIQGLAERGLTVFLVEHKMDFVRRLCDRIAVLATGELIADGPAADVFADQRVIDAYLGTAVSRA
jgi:ABC-type branched-subunit amino acid transport system ATPase component